MWSLHNWLCLLLLYDAPQYLCCIKPFNFVSAFRFAILVKCLLTLEFMRNETLEYVQFLLS